MKHFCSFVQFYVKSFRNDGLDCALFDEEAIILEYSSNGGVDWNVFHIIKLQDGPRGVNQIYQVTIPAMAMRPSTRLRWSQTTMGSPQLTWIIDEVHYYLNNQTIKY